MELLAHNAFVGGSSAGIGKATAIGLAAAGANVTLVARDRSRLESVLAQLDVTAGQCHRVLVADYSQPLALQTAVDVCVAANGPYQILINNSGGPPAGQIFMADIEQFDAAFAQHLKCSHLLVQSLVPGMKQAGFGRIINVISTSVKQPLPNLGVSNTIRGAVASWSKTLASELGPFGITVNNILPGATATDRLTSIIARVAEQTKRTTSQVRDEMLAEIPAGRFAAPDEIANAIVFLAGPRAGYINGVNLPVDGGRLKTL